jgi:hypothetical protein
MVYLYHLLKNGDDWGDGGLGIVLPTLIHQLLVDSPVTLLAVKLAVKRIFDFPHFHTFQVR